MKAGSDQGKSALAELYAEVDDQHFNEKSEDQKKGKEDENAAGNDLSEEGKLKLFVGGLYFQTESNLI